MGKVFTPYSRLSILISDRPTGAGSTVSTR
jgi:hypothetical protein